MPERRHVGGRLRQGQCDRDFFQIRQNHNGHDNAKYPARTFRKEQQHRRPNQHGCRFCSPGMVIGQPAEFQKAHDDCGDVTSNSCGQPALLFANHFRSEPPTRNGQRKIGEELGPAIEFGPEVGRKVKPAGQ